MQCRAADGCLIRPGAGRELPHSVGCVCGGAAMARALLRTLLLLVVAALISAANPKVKIGGALSTCGDSSDITIKIASALQWWASYINSHGGIIINDTQHDVEIITCARSVDMAHLSPLATTTRSMKVSGVRSHNFPAMHH